MELSNVSYSYSNIETFTNFVQMLIKKDPYYEGYILSCQKGSYNENILFFNIGGNYRYCPKINRHHRRNTIAIMINTKRKIYAIRCKDKECNNSILN